MKVSAIVSTYNSEEFIRGCLDDLLNQTLYKKGELEIIVINSGSQQNEAVIVEEYIEKYPRIKNFITERETLYAAWNRGVKLASGIYVTNANTDDRHRTDGLEILASVLDEKSNVGLVYGDCLITEIPHETFDNNSAKSAYIFPECSIRQALTRQFFGPHPMWRKELHDRIGYFDENCIVAGDYDFFIRAVIEAGGYHVKEFLSLYCRRKDSVERANKAKNIKEIDELIRRYRNEISIEKIYPGIEKYRSEKLLYSVLYNDLAMLYCASIPTYDIAIQLLNFAVNNFEPLPEIFNNIAVLFNSLGLREDAINILQKISGSGNPIILENLKLLQSGESALRLLEIKTGYLNTLPPVFSGDLELPLEKAKKVQKHLQGIESLLFLLKAQWKVHQGEFAEALHLAEEYRVKRDYSKFNKIDRRNNSSVELSAIIVAYKTGKGLIDCVNSLLRQTKKDFEIIVVDNGGNEDVLEELLRTELLYIIPGANVNPSEGRNIGAYFSRGKILYFVDDDAIVDKNTINAIAKSYALFPDIIGLRGKVIPKSSQVFNQHAGHYNLGDDFLYLSYMDTEGNSAILRNEYISLGGMNPLLFGGEGFEMSYRIQRSFGFGRILYSPEVVIYHDYADSVQKFENKSRRHNLMRELQKYLSPGINDFREIVYQRAIPGK